MDDNRQLLDDQDESVRIAVKALDDMRNSGMRHDITRSLPSPEARSSTSKAPQATPSTTSSQSHDSSVMSEASCAPAFVARMSSLPIVGSAMRVYEQGKASSRVMKYGAEMMESSVKAVSRPVIDRLPVNVNQLDDFACRQLDRLDRYRRPSAGAGNQSPSSMTVSPTSSISESHVRPKLKTKTLDGTAIEDDFNDSYGEATSRSSSRRWSGERKVPSWLEANDSFVSSASSAPGETRSLTPTQNGDEEQSQSQKTALESEQQQVAQRSRWQAVLLEAGGLSAALSEESMRRLKYCLQWLQYATAHIDAQILILRDFTANLQPMPSDDTANRRRPPISEEHMRKLIDVRRDIVHTIRQVVDVVSKYAGGALPEPARNRVRGFILKLPQRWASRAGPAVAATAGISAVGAERDTVAAAAGHGTGAVRRPGGTRRAAHRERGTGAPEPGMRSAQSSRAPSPSSSPRVSRASLGSGHSRHGEPSEHTHGEPVSASAALVASQRILTLATESLDMMRNVTGVVKDSLDRADAWVGRLRTVGIQRGAQEGENGGELDIAESDVAHIRHRHNDSTQSTVYDDIDTGSTGSYPSPFFSRASGASGSFSTGFSSDASTAWGSSIPSTPGGGAHTPSGSIGTAPSPGAVAMAIPLGAMSLASRYNTPKSSAASLPEEDEEPDLDSSSQGKGLPAAAVAVRVVGMDAESGEEGTGGNHKMEVDV